MPVPDSVFTYRHLFPQNPYPPQPPPPTIAHKVWLLDCRSCGMFLTNRGMKAVLLLRPNVSLYSSDALPVNCSVFSPTPDHHPPPAPYKPSGPPRTCECLTQSLCCHGCGTTIGYMIVVPCPRCTSSITATNRATNGHRFVFHSNEVLGTERRYIHDEPGVIPFDPPLPAPAPQYAEYAPPPVSPSFRADYLPTPPLEFATPRFVASYSRAAPEYDTSPHYYRVSSSRSPPPLHLRPASPDDYSTPSASPPPPLSPTSHYYPMDHKEPPMPLPSLKAGDIVFWHHLSRRGEIAAVAHDERARRPPSLKRPRQILFNR